MEKQSNKKGNEIELNEQTDRRNNDLIWIRDVLIWLISDGNLHCKIPLLQLKVRCFKSV